MKKIVVMILLLIVTVSSVSISVSADDNMIGSKFSKKYFNYYSDSHDKEDKLLLGVFLENDEVISSFSIDNQSDTVKYIREKFANIERISCYAMPMNILKKTEEELKKMHDERRSRISAIQEELSHLEAAE